MGRKALNKYTVSIEHQASQSREIKRLKARVRQLQSALDDTLGDGDCLCKELHHSKSDRHEYGQPCPVVARFRALLTGA